MNEHQEILVSVIIPTYLRPEYLGRALDCILAQTYQNLDIIVVDDNEPDSEARLKTEGTMEGYLKDPRIRYIKNKKNMGGSAARNVGIEAARGEYLAFLDDDDTYYPEKIEKQLKVFLNTELKNLALVYCDVEHVGRDEELHCVVRNRYRGNCLYESVLSECIASTSMWLVKKEALTAVGGFSIVPCKQDSTVLLKLLEHGYELDLVPEVLCRYYNWTGGVRISFGPKKLEGELLYMNRCRRIFDRFTLKQKKNIEFFFAWRAYVLYSYLKTAEGRQKMMGALRRMLYLNPFKGTAFVVIFNLRQVKRKYFPGSWKGE